MLAGILSDTLILTSPTTTDIDKEAVKKLMTRNRRKYGIWTKDDQVNWFKNEEEAFDILEYKGLKSYKSFFLLSLDDIRNYCINNDDLNSLLAFDAF